MSSKYLEWKYRDVKPDEPLVLTKEEKIKNWWYYHKWHVAAGVLLLLALADIGKNALGIGQVKPDYQIAYVGSNALPEDTKAALEEAIASLGEDLNHDGKVTVTLHQYASYGGEEVMSEKESSKGSDSDSSYYAYAAGLTLTADIESCDSYFFLLEKPETFQSNYNVLAYTDGTTPGTFASDIKNCYFLWEDCPLLSSLDLGNYEEVIAGETVRGNSSDLLKDLCFARRSFYMDRTVDYVEGCDRLWDTLTKGAKKHE